MGAASEAGMSIFATGYEEAMLTHTQFHGRITTKSITLQDYFLSQHSTIAVRSLEGWPLLSHNNDSEQPRVSGVYSNSSMYVMRSSSNFQLFFPKAARISGSFSR